MQVQVNKDNTPKSIKSFDSFGLFKVLLKNLFTHNDITFRPTLFQIQVIPNIMAGKDLLASAQNGPKKTVAYVLPIIHILISKSEKLSFDKNHVKPQVIILTSTKETTKYIYSTLQKLSENTHIKCINICAGKTAVTQQFKINHRNGIHILVAMPTRLESFVKKGIVKLSSVKICVLNDIDKMIKTNLKQEIKYILNHPTMTSKDIRQTLMFSTTCGNEILNMAKCYLNSSYVSVDVGVIKGVCKFVEQTIIVVNKFDKKKALLNLLKEMENGQSTIVFTREKQLIDSITSYLWENDFPATTIHGDHSKFERKEAIIHFKTNKMKILVTTAVCKELGIKDVHVVVNYDLPDSVDDYLYRIKFTGLLGNLAKCVSFFDPECDGPKASVLIGILQQVEQEIPQWLIKAADDYNVLNNLKTEKREQREVKNEIDLNITLTL